MAAGTFGIGSVFAGFKSARRKGSLSKVLGRASDSTLPFLEKTAGELKKWGQEDWDRFKQTYRPTAEAIVDDANLAPDYARYEGGATVAAAQGADREKSDIVSDASRSGSGPSSGSFAANLIKSASNRAANEGSGRVMGRLRADQISTDKKLNVLGLGRPDPSSAIAGLGIVSKGGAEYGKYSGAIGASSTGSLGNAGFGVGKAIGSYQGRSRDANTGPSSHEPTNYQWGNNSAGRDEFNSQNEAFGDDYSGDSFADGGIIRGPGTGRSDSIPAVIDGVLPARVSNGERLIPAHVAEKIGRPRLEGLVAISRQ